MSENVSGRVQSECHSLFRPAAVSVLLHPSTGDEEDKRFVCLTLVISLPQKVCLSPFQHCSARSSPSVQD